MKGSKASWLGVSFAVLLVLILASLWAVVFRVDLSPQVESDFFFSSEDRAFRDTQEIAEIFPASEQLLLNVSGPDRADPEYLDRIRKLSRPVVRLAKRATSLAVKDQIMAQLEETSGGSHHIAGIGIEYSGHHGFTR